MSVDPADEAPRSGPQVPGFSEAVTFAFGDPGQGLFGVARLGLAGAPGPQRTASGLALLFAGGEPVAVRADGGVEAEAEAGWSDLHAAGVRTSVDDPLLRWTVSFVAEDPATGFILTFTALSHAAELAADAPAARAGGMQGYEQLCRVTGTVSVAGRALPVACLGQRGRSWGAPDWDRIALARTVSGWLGDDLGFTATAIRPGRSAHHGDEALAAFLIARAPAVAPAPPDADAGPGIVSGDNGAQPDEPGDGLIHALPIEDPRLSTTYDADDRQRRAGVELYVREDDAAPRRAAGEVLCGTSLDLGRLRLDTAFFAWRMEGREGVGRYDIIRRTA